MIKQVTINYPNLKLYQDKSYLLYSTKKPITYTHIQTFHINGIKYNFGSDVSHVTINFVDSLLKCERPKALSLYDESYNELQTEFNNSENPLLTLHKWFKNNYPEIRTHCDTFENFFNDRCIFNFV